MSRCMLPAPVYVATFDDNTVGRISFASPEGNKPYDFERGRNAAAVIFARPEGAPAINAVYPMRTVVDGYVEHDVAGKPWIRVRDPQFSGEMNAKRKVINWKSLAAKARELLEVGDAEAALQLLAKAA